MKITGQILKENRLRKGVTISEVSLSTKITIKTLQAIEEGEPLNLPPKTFLRGFVRSYAVFLGLDPDEILRTFHEEMGSTLSRPIASSGSSPAELNAAATEEAAKSNDGLTTTLPGKTQPQPESSNSKNLNRPKANDAEATLRNEPSLLSRGLIFGGIILLIILIVVLKGKMDSYESERITEPGTVETAAPETESVDSETAQLGDELQEPPREGDGQPAAVVGTPTATPAPTATPKPSASPTPTATPKPSATPTPTATPKPSASPTPTATPKPSATPTPTATPKPSASPTPTATPKPSATPTPTATPTVVTNGRNSEVLIEALDQVDVEATIDGEAPRSLKLRAEQVQSIKVKKKVILKFSNGGAVNLIVNGVDRGVPGDLGKPMKVELP